MADYPPREYTLSNMVLAVFVEVRLGVIASARLTDEGRAIFGFADSQALRDAINEFFSGASLPTRIFGNRLMEVSARCRAMRTQWHKALTRAADNFTAPETKS
jgi:hypothetical protein